MENLKVLFTGGSGLLGTEIKKHRPDWHYPTQDELDVRDMFKILKLVRETKPDVIVHAAAMTGPVQCEERPDEAMSVNILGTMNIIQAAGMAGIRVVYISTDYVYPGFCGDEAGSNYPESMPIFPSNKYAWSKMGGECAAMMYNRSTIIRTSFGPNQFQYDAAYTDQWTSREPVSIIALKIINVIETPGQGIINVGGPRKTVYQYALENNPEKKEIEPISRTLSKLVPPEDTSLDTTLYKKIFEGGTL